MLPQDDPARDPVRPHAERWAADSPFVGEAVAEEQAPIHPWYQGYTPFVEGGEPEETYAPEAGWEAHLALEDEFAFEEPGIIAGENRVRVKKTDGVPWRWICKIAIKDRQDRYFAGGTGVLISPRHVLTAAHVVYPEYTDPYNYSVEVIPALDGGDEPFGTHSLSATPGMPKNYDPKAQDHLDWDYSLITLKDRVGTKTFSRLGGGPLYYWGHPTGGANTIFVRSEPRTLNGKPVLTAGYPNSMGFDPRRGGTQLWCAAGMLHSADRRRRKMGITADTTKGQSGSPVWIVENGRYCLVGIAVGAGRQTNFVVRVTRELIRQLRAWIAEDGETPSMIETEEALESPSPTRSHAAAEHYSASEWSPEPAAEDAEDFTSVDYEEDGLRLPHQRPLEERFDPSTIPNVDPYSSGGELEESEFRLDRLPAMARQHFGKGGASWRDAVAEAIRAGISNPNDLADLIFYMQHPGRMTAGVGKPIDKNEGDFFKLRAEWNLYRTIATGLLKPATAKPARAVFLPANQSTNYEDYVAAPTTGRITLMINGRDSRGSGPFFDEKEAFDSMQKAVESLGPNDSVLLAAWQFDPTVPLTSPGPSGVKTWGDLFQGKANEGVKIRIIMTDFAPVARDLHEQVYRIFLPALDKHIGQLSAATCDNLKYIVSRHPATQFRLHVAVHHQKFMVVRKGGAITTFCGGLDISFRRTPAYWSAPNYPWLWHDIHAKLEGLIARDLEREFIRRWNREKGQLSVARSQHTGKQAFEDLSQAPVGLVNRKADNNTQTLQMLRTVSVQGVGQNIQTIKRDDIWQGYFRLIGCATRFIYMENQYFREPRMADAIVKQAQAQSGLIVVIVVPEQLDDPDDPIKRHGNSLQHEFFTRLSAGIAATNRLRVYTMFNRIIHSKFILVDDQALSMGSANANPRGFFLDTELNVMLDDADAVKSFRHRLWSHNLGVPPTDVADWEVKDFMAKWDAVAKANEALKKTPDEMTGEGVIPFDPLREKGQRSWFIHDVLTEI
jgi:phosphatidylserine/phosphatidylglycerophosphate/cardiolipin synthase-like enzyme/V8-like Glu-specific endopeptidase